MTPEEAIEMLTGKREVKNARCNGKNKTMDELRQVVIEALEKQIAIEPVMVTMQNVAYPQCPKCGRTLWGKEHYCATCGQKVNRGE